MFRRKKIQRFLSLGLSLCLVLSMLAGLTGASVDVQNDTGGRRLVCDLQEHTHDDACYVENDSEVLRCTFEPHRHDGGCFDELTGALVCGQPEFALHLHDTWCYDADGNLVCMLPQYWHEMRRVKICGDVESHVHNEGCYERRLICGYGAAPDLSDGLSDVLSDDDGVLLEHVHDESCYDSVLICEKHVCSDDCFADADVIMTEGRDGPAALASDFAFISEHQHDGSCFEAVNSGRALVCDKKEHTHGSDCYEDAVPDEPSESEEMNRFIADADAFIAELNAGKYDNAPEDGRKALTDFAHYRETIHVTDIPEEQMARFYACLDRLEQAKEVFEARAADLNKAVQASEKLAKLQSDIESLVADIESCEDMSEAMLAGLLERLIKLEAVRDEIDAAVLDDAGKAALEMCAATLASLREMLDSMTLATGFVAVKLQARVRQYLGASGSRTFKLIPAGAVSGFTGITESGLTARSGASDGAAVFPDISFTAAGSYLFYMSMVQESGVRADTRSYIVTVNIAESNGALYLKSVSYVDPDGMYAASGEYASFLALGNAKSGYSAASYKKANAVMESMTMEERLGQCFMLHYPGDGSGTAAQAAVYIDKYHIGSYLVFAAMFDGATPDSVRAKISAAQERSKIPMLFAVDEEGGRVVRISKFSQFRSTAFPYSQDLKAAGGGTPSAVPGDVAEKATLLSGLGLNVNLAPVADISQPSGFIWSRTWGEGAWLTGDYVGVCSDAYNGTGVGNALKHFPGYGRTGADTHADANVNTISKNAVYWHELAPFYAGVDAGADSILVTHNIMQAFDASNPCSLSPAIYDIARSWMGYDGVIMTDDLAMGAITKYVAEGQASLRALQAGADIAMTPSPDKDIPVALAAMQAGTLSEAEVDAKCRRVLAWKAELGLLDDIVIEPDPPVDPSGYDIGWWAPGATEPKYFENGQEGLSQAKSVGGKIEVYRNFVSDYVDFSANTEVDLQGHTVQVWSSRWVVMNGANLTVMDSVGSIADTVQSTFSEDSSYDRVGMKLKYVALKDAGDEAHVADFSKVGRLEFSGGASGEDEKPLIYVDNGMFIAKNVVLRRNSNMYARRGILTSNSSNNRVVLEDAAVVGFGPSSFSDASARGGGVYIDKGQLIMTRSYIAGCSGFVAGGVYLNSGTTGRIAESVIAQNAAKINGGGLYVSGSSNCTVSNSVVTGNLATNNGGNIYVGSGSLNITGVSSVSYGTTNNGGGIFGWGTGMNIVLNSTIVAKNTARVCGGGINVGYDGSVLTPGNNLTLSGTTTVRDNRADGFAGGVYSNAVVNALVDQPMLANNVMAGTDGDVDCNWYLLEGQLLQLPQHFGPRASVRVYTVSPESEVQVIQGSNYKPDSTDVSYVVADRRGYATVLQSGIITFIGAKHVDTPCYVMLDGHYYEFGRIENVWDDANGREYVCLNDMAQYMQDVSFDIGSYNGANIVGVRKAGSDDVTMPSLQPFFKDGLWYVYLPDGADLTQDSLVVLSNGANQGTLPVDGVKAAYGYFSVRVKDMYAASGTGYQDESFLKYVPAGGSLTFELSERTGEWEWKVGSHDPDDFIVTKTVSGGKVRFAVSAVHAPVVILSGNTEDIRYTVQYYGQVRSLRFYNVSGDDKLQVINTKGRVMPKTGDTENTLQARNGLTYLRINNGSEGEFGEVGEVDTQETLQRIYADRSYIYSDAPTLIQIDQLFTDDHYSLEELWVLKDGRNPESVNREDWDIYNRTTLGLSSIHDLKLTNSPEFAVMNDVLLVPDDAVMRMVYESTVAEHDAPVMFYDYDITDGFVYDAAGTAHPTSEQSTLSGQLQVKTTAFGINDGVNYSGSGQKFGFGNGNTGTWRGDATFDGGWFNKYDRLRNTYRGCSFGLVTGLDSNGHPVYASEIDVPKLFDDGDAVGKTAIEGHNLRFNRYGDTYTLQAVTGTNTDNLHKFNHPTSHTGVTYNHIWTNNYWPADDFETFGADGHDVKWGDNKQTICFNNTNNALPVADDGRLHNCYFGMSFQVKFALPEGYAGGLEYVFFGDDDMWIFLDDQLVLDVGGVHSSVGEYVDLWDYIEQGDTSEHTLQVFYTERGASGSTCWMHFTIPKARFIADSWSSNNGNLKLAKTIEGMEQNAGSTYLFDIDITDAEGNPVSENYSCVLYNKTGEPAEVLELENGHGTMGITRHQVLNILYIPVGYHYRVTEHKYDCDTRVVVDGVVTEGMDISGVITRGKSNQAEFINDFSVSGPRLPSVGGIDYGGLLAGVGICAFCGGALWWSVREKRRRVR